MVRRSQRKQRVAKQRLNGPVPRKRPVKIAAGPVPAKITKVVPAGTTAKLVTKNKRVQVPYKSPAIADHSRVKLPIKHIEQRVVKDEGYWRDRVQLGDMLIAKISMTRVNVYPDEQDPAFPYLCSAWERYGGRYNNDDSEVKENEIGIYAGTIRTVERGKNGDVSVLRHTAIFKMGRYVLTDLNAVVPATL